MVPLPISDEALAAFCRKWKIRELWVFGSALRPEDFNDESDFDLIADFEPDAPWGLFDLMHLEWELTDILGRRAEVIERRAIEEDPNYIRREHILGQARLLYAA